MIPIRRLGLAAIALALLGHSLVFNFVCDDAYISFVYSRNLAEQGQLVFNLGERVEGYTNFLWTVLLGLLMKIGIAPEVSSRVLGTAFGIATLAVVVRLSKRLRGAPSAWDLLTPAFLAASSGYACWCSGGLETQMFTFFVILGIEGLLAERPARSGAAFALSAMTRPEGLLVTGLGGLYVLIRRRFRIRREDVVFGVFFLATFLAIWAPYFAWRSWYYGWPFPNTFYVKAGGTPPPGYAAAMLANGLHYVWTWALQSRAIFLVPFVALGVALRPAFGLFALALGLIYLAYAAAVGGDFMGLHRFVMPVFVLTYLLAALGLEKIGQPIVAVLVVAGFAASQIPVALAARVGPGPNDHGIDRPGYLKLYAHDRELIGRALAPHIRPDDYSILGGAGVQPYYGRMRGVDVFGLVSEDIAHNVPPTNPRPGHQKWADAPRLLALQPTFLFECYDMHRDPQRYGIGCPEGGFMRAHGYEPVTIFVPGLKERGEYYTFLKRKDRAWP